MTTITHNLPTLKALGEPGDRAVAEKIGALVEAAASIAITGHERPDGDCIGSEVALCSILRAMGKRAEIVNSDPTPARYANLDEGGAIRTHIEGRPFNADLVFVLDATDIKRIGRIQRADFGAAKIVDIDHHPGNPHFGDVNFVDTAAAAAGELIYRIAAELKWPIPEQARLALYTALVTDTGHFAYGNTTSRVLRMAAELRDLGVDGEAVWRRIYLNKTAAELALEARARASLECFADGKICAIGLKHSDFAETGTTPQNSEDFAGIPRMLAGVELALFFYEINGGKGTKVSIRSSQGVDASALAKIFGGGGHKQASGCSFDAPLAEAKARLLEEAGKLF